MLAGGFISHAIISIIFIGQIIIRDSTDAHDVIYFLSPLYIYSLSPIMPVVIPQYLNINNFYRYDMERGKVIH